MNQDTVEHKALKELRVLKEQLVPRETKDGVDTRDKEESQELVEWLVIKGMMDQPESQDFQ